jgi:hypothetical protein
MIIIHKINIQTEFIGHRVKSARIIKVSAVVSLAKRNLTDHFYLSSNQLNALLKLNLCLS